MSAEGDLVLNIEKETTTNKYYREVIYTSPNMQLVLMSLRPGEIIPQEIHSVDQFVRVEKGEGVTIIGGQKFKIDNKNAVIVPAGVSHYFANTGGSDLKIYTIYAPPEHSSTKIDVINELTGELYTVRP